MSSDEQDRPPGSTGRLEDYANIPRAYPRADTGPLRQDIHEAMGVRGQGPTAHDIAASLAGLMSVVSNNPEALKRVNHKNWLVNAIIAVVVAASGAVAAYKATEDRSLNNERGVQQNAEAINKVQGEVETVQLQVVGVGKKLDDFANAQREMILQLQETQRAVAGARDEQILERLRELERRRARDN